MKYGMESEALDHLLLVPPQLEKTLGLLRHT